VPHPCFALICAALPFSNLACAVCVDEECAICLMDFIFFVFIATLGTVGDAGGDMHIHLISSSGII
jgi:hypothetical protein